MDDLLDTASECTETRRERRREQRQAHRINDNGHLVSRVIKRSILVGAHRSSVSLEDAFWNELRAIACERHVPLSQLVGGIDAEREHCNLSSAIRVFVFELRCGRMEGAHEQSDSADSHAPRQD